MIFFNWFCAIQWWALGDAKGSVEPSRVLGVRVRRWFEMQWVLTLALGAQHPGM